MIWLPFSGAMKTTRFYDTAADFNEIKVPFDEKLYDRE